MPGARSRGTGPSWFGLAANLLLSLASILVFVLVCETVVFRFLLLPSDFPRNAYIDGLIRLEPNQTGVFRLRDEIAARFEVNGQGWNSGRGDYARLRDGARPRIAIIGDSYVEALQVPATESLAEQLQRRLEPAEVLRFGISGAPLSHYLYMLEHLVVDYAPDLAVIVLVHNDFDESFRFKAGRYTSSFMKLALLGGEVVAERSPVPYRRTFWDTLRESNTLRYLYYRQRISLAGLKYRLLERDRRFEANIDLGDVAARFDDVRVATDYLFGRLAAAAARHGIQLLLLMDGSRQAIYHGTAQAGAGVLALNDLALALAARHGIPFVDLQPRFAAAWRQAGGRFDFPSDNHWNRRGHAIAAAAIEDFLRSDVRLADRFRPRDEPPST
jgi:hypothetical protein